MALLDFAAAKIRSIQRRSAAVRDRTSASCSGVGSVWPVHGSSELFEPGTSITPNSAPPCDHRTFSSVAAVLRGDRDLVAERLAAHVEELRANRHEALERVEAAVVGPVAVGPLVVARRVDERILEAVELRADEAK